MVLALGVQRSAFSVQRSAFSVQRSAFSVQRSAFSVKFREHFRFQIPKIKVINQLDSGFAFSVILQARLSDGFDDQLSEREAER
jgi:hypothetical protein